jgi:hypothetical protein
MTWMIKKRFQSYWAATRWWPRIKLDFNAPVNVIHLPIEKSEKGFSDLKIKSGINLFIGNPDMLLHSLLKHPSLMLGGNYNIGLWFWELEEAPRAWHLIKHWVDEIWVQSCFVLYQMGGKYHLDMLIPQQANLYWKFLNKYGC